MSMKPKASQLALICLVAGFFFRAQGEDVAQPAYGAVLRIPPAGVEFRPRALLSSGSAVDAVSGRRADKDGIRSFFIRLGGSAGQVDGSYRIGDAEGGVDAEWNCSPCLVSAVQAFELRGIFGLEYYAGGAYEADGVWHEIPFETPKREPLDGEVRKLSLFDVDGVKRLTLELGEKRHVALARSGDPKIGGKLFLRILMADGDAVKSPSSVRVRFSTPSGLRIGPEGRHVICGKEWIVDRPVMTVRPGSVLDFSALRPTGDDAGKWGYPVVRGDHFEFEGRPGASVRFNATAFGCGAVLPPTEADAERLAERLARAGYNAVRLQSFDGLVLRNPQTNSWEVGGEAMRRFDAFNAALFRHGIYVTSFVGFSGPRSWVIRRQELGLEGSGRITSGEFKALVQVDENVFSNYIAFVRSLLGHRNAYTGRTYAKEPAWCLFSLMGEACLGGNTAALEKWPQWREAWRRWLGLRRTAQPESFAGIPADSFPKSVMEPTRHATAFKLFLGDMESRFAARVLRVVRDELGCRAPAVSMEGVFYANHIRKARVESYDFLDQHFYIDHPNFISNDWKPPATVGNRSPVFKAMGAQFPALFREFGKPFVVSEWNCCAPNPNRSVGGLLVGAAAAFQDWAAITHFNYADKIEEYVSPETEKMEFFTVAMDPIARAYDSAVACLYLRGDMKTAKHAYAINVPASVFAKPMDVGPDENPWSYLNWVAWHGRVGTVTAHEDWPEGVAEICRYPDSFFKHDVDVVRRKVVPTMGDGQLEIDAKVGTFAVKTERTCGAFSPEGVSDAGAVRFSSSRLPTTVWASTVDGRSISESRRLVVFHLTDSANTNLAFTDESCGILEDWGHAPQLVRKAKAEVSVTVSPGDWKVYALGEDGARRYSVPCVQKSGRLAFTADTAGSDGYACLRYELVEGE